jgi:hypothetical protein
MSLELKTYLALAKLVLLIQKHIEFYFLLSRPSPYKNPKSVLCKILSVYS